MEVLQRTAAEILSPGKGMLVVDEYVDRLVARVRAAAGSPVDECRTGQYLDVALGAWGLDTYVSSVLLSHEAFAGSERLRRLRTYTDGPAPIRFGLRMDATRTRVPPSGNMTPRQDEVYRQLREHRAAGAAFVEWRANLDPLSIGPGEVHIDAPALAQGAAISQAAGMLPVITVAMPDLASHGAAVTQAVTSNALRELFGEIRRFDVDPSALVVRTNMIVPGDAHPQQTPPEAVAQATLQVLGETAPAALAGVVLLSGGMAADRAAANLAALTALAQRRQVPWRPTFAFSRALVEPSVRAWNCDPANAADAQRELIQSCRRMSQAVSAGSVGASSVTGA